MIKETSNEDKTGVCVDTSGNAGIPTTDPKALLFNSSNNSYPKSRLNNNDDMEAKP